MSEIKIVNRKTGKVLGVVTEEEVIISEDWESQSDKEDHEKRKRKRKRNTGGTSAGGSGTDRGTPD